MSSVVKATVVVLSNELKMLEAIRKALTPDNKITPPGMSVEDSIKSLDSKYGYFVRIIVGGKHLRFSIQRAKSTVDEILSIINMLLKQIEVLTT